MEDDETSLKGRKSKAMADQIATVSKRRLINREGRLGRRDIGNIEHAVKLQLGMLEHSDRSD